MCVLVEQISKPSVEKPWLKYFSEEAVSSEIPEDTIYNYIVANNKEHRDDIAINYFGNKITYGKLIDSIDAAAAAFESLGIKAGDVVPCCSATVPEMVYALYGLNKIGAAMLTLDPRRSTPEILEFVKSSGSKVMLIIDLAVGHILPSMDELGLEKVVVVSADTSMPFMVRTVKQLKVPAPKIDYSDRVVTWNQFFREGKGKESSTAQYKPNNLAAITLTGGTTGSPKGVMISDDGFNAIAFDFKHCGVKYTRDQRFLDIIPIFASYGIVSSLHMPLSLGLEIVMIPKFNADKVGHIVKKYKPSHTLLVPAHYEKLMNSKEMANGFDLSFFETAGSGGDTMNKGLESKLNGFLAEHGCKYPLSQGYGMSEVSSAASCCCNGNFKSLSVGYPLLTTTVGIFKPGTTIELGYGEEGEICITGPSVMMGYYNNKEETDKVLVEHPDGQVWVHSGDLGMIDEDGFLFIQGRIKRMITRFDGHKIFPTQIEGIIGEHKSVMSCAVVGVKDAYHAQGMEAVAYVELHENTDEVTARRELEEIFRDSLEDRGRPIDLIFIDSMPHSGMGKIDYAKLSAQYENTRVSMVV